VGRYSPATTCNLGQTNVALLLRRPLVGELD
jgi:hypothetical protein